MPFNVVGMHYAGDMALQADENLNDSDKVFSVPTNKKWMVLWIHVEFTTTATLTNRLLTLRIRDDGNDAIYQVEGLNEQAPSATEVYIFLPGIGEPTEGKATRHFLPLPALCLLPHLYSIHILDVNAVDAAADDMIVQMMVLELPM